jgi:hypothetical protein
MFDEKHISENVISSPPSQLDHGITKDWDEEESAVRRKYGGLNCPTHESLY